MSKSTKYSIQVFRCNEWRHVTGIPFEPSKERALNEACRQADSWSRYHLFVDVPMRIVEAA